MKVLCQFGSQYRDEAHAIALDGFREDIGGYQGQGSLDDLVARYAGRGLTPLFLMAAPSQTDRNYQWALEMAEPVIRALMRGLSLPELAQSGIEVFNEPVGREGKKTGPGDMVTQDQYVAAANHYKTVADRLGYTGRIWAGGLGNLSKDSFDWYSATVPYLLPDIGVCYHGYPYGTLTEHKPWPPYRTWPAAIKALQDIAVGRPVACSEDGQHTHTEEEGGFGPFGHRTVQRTDAQVRAFWADRLHMGEYCGLEFYVMFQWQNGPTDVWGDLYGLHLFDGLTRKEQAYAILDYKNGRSGMNPIVWKPVKPAGTTLVNTPSSHTRTLNPSVPGPWVEGGHYGPYVWSERTDGGSGPYEQVILTADRAIYNPTGHEMVVFPYVPASPNGGSAGICEEAL